MYQFRLPMKVEELNVLLVEGSSEYETILGIGIGHMIVTEVYKWVYRIHKPFGSLAPDIDTTDLDEFVETVSGLWQLRVVANLGKSYLKNLRETLLKNSEYTEFTILQFARELNKAIGYNPHAMDTDYIFSRASNLINARYNVYHPTSLEYPESTLSKQDAVNLVTFSMFQLKMSMVYIMSRSLNNIPEDNDLKDTLTELAKDIRKADSSFMSPLNSLATEIETVLKEHKLATSKVKQKKLGLKLI